MLDVLFETPGDVRLEHRTPDHVYDLGTISVTGAARSSDAAASFDSCAQTPSSARLAKQLERDLERPPDKVLAFWSEMPLLYGDDGTKTDEPRPPTTTCPMHPEIAASFAGTCPKCGMKLVPATPDVPTPMPFACPMHDEIVAAWAASCPLCGMTLLAFRWRIGADRTTKAFPTATSPGDSIEWEDDMVAINRQTEHQQHDLATHRPRDRREERRHLLEVHGRRSRQDPPGQRDGLRPPDAAPVPCPWRRTVSRVVQGRRDRAQPRLEGHGAAARRPNRRHPAVRHESRTLDGALPHRGAQPERHDVQLRRSSRDQADVDRANRLTVDRDRPGDGVPTGHRAVAFADLAGYTALTEAHGDDGAADVALRFFDITARDSVADARIVKTIGDAVMVVTSDAYDGSRSGSRSCARSSRNRTSPVCGSACTTGQSWNETATSSERR